MIVLVVWSANGDGIVVLFTTSKASSKVNLRTNRARCALYKKILDLLDEEIVSGESVVDLVYKFDESILPRMFKKVS